MCLRLKLSLNSKLPSQDWSLITLKLPAEFWVLIWIWIWSELFHSIYWSNYWLQEPIELRVMRTNEGPFSRYNVIMRLIVTTTYIVIVSTPFALYIAQHQNDHWLHCGILQFWCQGLFIQCIMNQYLLRDLAWHLILCQNFFSDFTLLHRWELCSWDILPTSIVQTLIPCDCRWHWFVVWSLSLEISPPSPFMLVDRSSTDAICHMEFHLMYTSSCNCKTSDRPHTCFVLPSALWYIVFQSDNKTWFAVQY